MFCSDEYVPDFLHCHHNFTGPFTKHLKIRLSHPSAAVIESLNIKFSPSHYVFTGIAENFPKLKHLSVIKQSIKFVERENFAGLESLETLRLYRNQIESLPEDAFYDLPNLKILNLSCNQIKQFPTNIFSKLAKVEEIWINDNPGTTDNVNFSGISQVKLYNETTRYYFSCRGEKSD
jgi:Leucine-rich repeat (LRR) protein